MIVSLCVLFAFDLLPVSPDAEPVAGICLSFDDRSISEWSTMLPLLERYKARVTFFVTQFDSLTDDEILMLRDFQRCGHEIGSHGAIHVNSEHYIREFGYSSYLFREVDRNFSLMRNAGFEPTSFAYPYGAKYWFTDYLIKRRVRSTRGTSVIPKGRSARDVDEIYAKRGERNTFHALGIDDSNITLTEIRDAMDWARQKRKVLFLYGHGLGSGAKYSFRIEFLDSIMQLAQENHLRFFTIREVPGE